MKKIVLADGTKTAQRKDTEWRALPYLHWRHSLEREIYGHIQLPPVGSSDPVKPYSLWHYTLGRRLNMVDVDFIEWRFRANRGESEPEMYAAGVMEVTRVDLGKRVDDAYRNQVLARYDARDLQGKAARKLAQALNTKAYIVLFREDCSEFWVYNLTDNWEKWRHFPAPALMAAFIRGLQ
jgi:hypothetical protein